jgi:hypothetical protein
MHCLSIPAAADSQLDTDPFASGKCGIAACPSNVPDTGGHLDFGADGCVRSGHLGEARAVLLREALRGRRRGDKARSLCMQQHSIDIVEVRRVVTLTCFMTWRRSIE